MTLGEQIKRARESKNLSQEELATRLEVSRQAVSKWENDIAIPQGLNREMLSKVLEIEFAVSEGESVRNKKKLFVALLGWLVAMILLVILVICIGTNKNERSDDENLTEEAHIGENEEKVVLPKLKQISFYDDDQNIVIQEALWYNAARIDSILVQWEGGTPDNIKVFAVPTGTETLDKTSLLLTKPVLDGDTVALLSADVLKDIDTCHVYIQLDFGNDNIVKSEDYNVFYDSEWIMD